jgi:hypothetical protein
MIWRPHSSSDNGSVETVLQVLSQSPGRLWQYFCEIGVCKTSIHHILQGEKMSRVKWSMEYSPQFPNLMPLDFCLWGDLKNTVHQKTKNSAGHEVQNWNCLCFYSTSNRVRSLPLLHIISNSALGLVVEILNVCEFKVTSETMINICQL